MSKPKFNFKKIGLASAYTLTLFAAQAQYDPLRPFPGKIGKTLDESQQVWNERAKAPKDAPNVVVILLDDVGYGATSPFGGLIETPNLDKLAKNGLKYTNFHTTGICSPTRAALLTGRNSHAVAMGHHAELGIGSPGYSGDIPFEAGTIAEIFKENGYNTFALGKWHGNAPKDLTPAGPFNRYPTSRGFEHFYGFLGGATDQWHPQLVEENNQVDIEPNTKHLNQLLADKAISYIANQKSSSLEKPFFLYLATGAGHSPHQVSKEWIEKYKGKFDKGWDWYREEVFKRQQALGVIPKNAVLPSRQEGLKAWESLSADEKKVFTRFFEVYAGFLSYTDYEIGRIVSYLEEINQLDNTAIFVVIGDNGGSKEGTYTGTIGTAEKAQGDNIAFLLSKIDKFGTEYTNQNYPLGWSQATNTPFRYWKSDANSEGGTHNPLIVHWTNGLKQKGGLRSQYSHVTDILPTIVELTGVKVPDFINGYKQLPIHGNSLVYSFEDNNAATRHRLQYYELHGGRSIYKDGWKASVYHPRNTFDEKNSNDPHFNPRPFSEDKWELYNLNEDPTEIKDLATQNPQKLEELKKVFDSVAIANNVYPLHNYRSGVPTPPVKSKMVIYRGTNAKIRVNIGKKNVSITANIQSSKANVEGVIWAAGGLTGGQSLFVKDNKLTLLLNDGISETVLTSTKPLAVGQNEVKINYGEDNVITLYLNNEQVAQTKVNSKSKYLSAISGEGIGIGKDYNSPVTKVYKGTFPFNGDVSTVVVEQVIE